MARYILTNIDTGAILGQEINERSIRPFLSIAEAYRKLAQIEASAGTEPDDMGETFVSWAICEINPVERP